MSDLAVVTGASSGIGAELARQLAQRGQPVLAVARRAERLDELAAWAKQAGTAPIHPLAIDVTADGAAEQIAARARQLGGAGWLVNNAGTARLGPFADDEVAQQTASVRLNCEALVALTGAFVPELLARGRGVILNLASGAGFQPTPFMSTYGATKAFVISFSEALAEELRGRGVTVTAVCPGPVTTEIFSVSGLDAERTKAAGEMTAEDCARFALAAADKGRVIAIPGFGNKLLAMTTQVAPRALVRRIAAKVSLKRLGYAVPTKP